jgi:hypothetical protein
VSDALIVPLRSKRQRRAQALQKLNHMIPAFGLLVAGQQALTRSGGGFGFYLGVFEIASAVALIVLAAREIRGAVRHRAQAHATHHVHGIDWVDVAAAFVLFGEAAEHWHTTHHVARPVLLTAIVTLAMGLSHGRIIGAVSRRRVLRVDETGVYVGGRFFNAGWLQASWDELDGIEVGERWATVRTRAGRVRRIDLEDAEGEAHLRHALMHARGRLDSLTPPRESNTAE